MKDSFPELKREINSIDVPEEKLEKAIINGMNKGKKKWSSGKKFTYSLSAVIVFFALLIGSAFVSPTVANVLAKVPFLSTIFESDPAVSGIVEQLDNKGYDIQGASFRVKGKELSISVGGSDEYFNDVKGEIEEIARDMLEAKGYDAYTLKVEKYEPFVPDISEETKAYMQETDKLMAAIDKNLDTQTFKDINLGIRNNKIESFISLAIPNTYTEKQIAEIKSKINKGIREADVGEFPIKVDKINMEIKAQEQRWMPVINTVFEGLLAKKEYKVTGVGYSFHPLPLRLEIRTSVKSTDPEAKELGKKIEDTIHNFIESDEVEDNVKNDPYRIEVMSKDKKKIN